MRFLLDMPVSPSLLQVLATRGHTGIHACQIGCSRSADEDLLTLARDEGRVVITADLDFPRHLALSAADGPGLILFRGGSFSDDEMRSLLEQVLDRVPAAAIERSISVVDRKRVRVTPLPIVR